jgi:hypothetical protein
MPWSRYTQAELDKAERVIDAAGEAGGIDEVRRIAEHGWPLRSTGPDHGVEASSRQLDAIQEEAQRRVMLAEVP